MQTFLPYPNFETSVQALDYKRLGKQRVEASQILDVLEGRKTGWRNHPAVKMWEGYEEALKLYLIECIKEWVKRGYKNNMILPVLTGPAVYPSWFGNNQLHESHQSNLKRKDPVYYGHFCISPDLPYVWPV